MYGALPSVAEGVSAAMGAAPDNLMGVGMAPEGIEQNPAVYEFMSEMAFKGQAAAAAAPGGLAAWFQRYAQRRYGAAGPLPVAAAAAVEGAWKLLARNVYSCRDQLHNTVVDIPTSRPGLSRAEIVGWGLGPHLWYDVGEVRAAWELLLQAAAACPALADSSSAFNYDLLDVSRELMSKIAGRFWADVVEAYRGANLAGVRGNGTALLTLLADMDELLGSHKGFLLGPVLARARGFAKHLDSSTNASLVHVGGGQATETPLDPGAAADDDDTISTGLGAEGSSSSSSSIDGASEVAYVESNLGSNRRRSLDSSDTFVAAADSDIASEGAARDEREEQVADLAEQQLGAFYEWNMRTQLTIW
jgi:hypothetical protein